MESFLVLPAQSSNFFCNLFCPSVRGAVASWLVRSTPDGVVWVRVLAGVIVLCSWARYFTLMYKWVPANLMLGVKPVMD